MSDVTLNYGFWNKGPNGETMLVTPRWVAYGRKLVRIEGGGKVTVPPFVAVALVEQGGLSELPSEDLSRVDVREELAKAPPEHLKMWIEACNEKHDDADHETLRQHALDLHDGDKGPGIRKVSGRLPPT